MKLRALFEMFMAITFAFILAIFDKMARISDSMEGDSIGDDSRLGVNFNVNNKI
ncbi:hypothetical protein [Hathewaya limosa]|uniref:Uncharacterized protein n=1 Tax=Hathewaya limosa TaxID=1536 RepID=A0ABU0JW37_HATLI|nr:hypothetical protein [Hathewaya limosa]MDQ0480353.1 hypothetical protein [Hathewaya limosa]